MKRSSVLFAGAGMLLLILDSRCAARSAANALDLCLKTVIPSLFPMFVLSGMLVSGCSGASRRLLTGLEHWIGLPKGNGTLFLMGILGGFPVGAQSIAQAVENRNLSKSDGERMLGFCNNCSPAFLFGITARVFSDPAAPLWIFLIQLESALVVAAFTSFEGTCHSSSARSPLSLTDAVIRGMRSMASVCAWVILAGVAVGFLERWIYPILPGILPQIITGSTEITGGILGLSGIPDEGLRFMLCSGCVCFGGFCVWMQIRSLASVQGLSTGHCFRQKTVQAVLGLILAEGIRVCGPVTLAIVPVLLVIRKITLENPDRSMYNSSRKGGLHHVVP